jgi:hypothetical protein
MKGSYEYNTPRTVSPRESRDGYDSSEKSANLTREDFSPKNRRENLVSPLNRINLLSEYYKDYSWNMDSGGKFEVLYICNEGRYSSVESAVKQGPDKCRFLEGGSQSRKDNTTRDMLKDANIIRKTFDRVCFENPLDKYQHHMIYFLDGIMDVRRRSTMLASKRYEVPTVPNDIEKDLMTTGTGELMLELVPVLPKDMISVEKIDDGDILLCTLQPEEMRKLPENENIYFISKNHGIFILNPNEQVEINSLSQPYCLKDIRDTYLKELEKNPPLSEKGNFDWEVRNTSYGTVARISNQDIENKQNTLTADGEIARDKMIDIVILKYMFLKRELSK